LPAEPPPPAAELVSQVAGFEAKLAADGAYKELWKRPRAELNLFLTFLSELLAAGGSSTDITKPVRAKRLQDAGVALYMVFVRKGSFPVSFTSALQNHLAATKGDPRQGTWSPYTTRGTPIHDYTALAAWLNPESASYLREHLAAKREGPCRWRAADPRDQPSRPWLVFEIDGLNRLALLPALSPLENARLALLKTDAAAVKVSIDELIGEYHDNEVRADLRFKGHLVRFSGTVMGVEKDLMGQAIVKVSGGLRQFGQVWCYVDDVRASAELNAGDEITVRGRVEGSTMKQVVVRNCAIAR
jgi:hypothetical protein